MADAFEILLSLGSGIATGAAKRKRENELLQLEEKQRSVKRIESNVTQALNLSFKLADLGLIDPETLLSTIPLIRRMASEGESPIKALTGIQVRPEEERPPTRREKFAERQDVREEDVDFRERKFTFEKEIQKERLQVSRERQTKLTKTESRRTEALVLRELGKDADDIRRQIFNNQKILPVTADSTPTEKTVARKNIRELNEQLRNVEQERSKTFKKLGIDRKVIEANPKRGNVKPKVEVFKNMIQRGLITPEDAIRQVETQLIRLIQRKKITEAEAAEILTRFQRAL